MSPAGRNGSFVKLHTHGMQSRQALLGGGLDTLFTAMEEQWNRPPFRLHYVTAREAYNIVKAAEAGRAGNPDDYRDLDIPPPANRKIRCDGPWCLLRCTPERILPARPRRRARAHRLRGPALAVGGGESTAARRSLRR